MSNHFAKTYGQVSKAALAERQANDDPLNWREILCGPGLAGWSNPSLALSCWLQSAAALPWCAQLECAHHRG